MQIKTWMILTTAALLTISTKTAFSSQETLKGLLPEVRLNSDNEEQNTEKAFQSELMITKAETKAIESLNKIIIKKKGTAEESDLLFRLAELYMRRAKSGRFFDLNSKDPNINNNQKAQESLKSAIQIYNRIEKDFPKYKELDAVLFNNAIAHQQTKQLERSKELYNKLVNQFPKSNLLPDALLEVGEVYYSQQNFALALEKFKAIEQFPKSRAYPYGIYKSAWCYYNLKQTEEGIKQLKNVVAQNPADSTDKKKYNLRKEALRDLTLFVGETLPPEQLYSFFEKITTTEELGEALMSLSSIYESHSRFKEINIFVKEFINNHPENPNTAKCYAKLIDTNETLKLRPEVIKYMKKMADFCVNKPNADCHDDFRKISLEISKKWWEIWLKNKTNTEFSKLTEEAFEIILSNDDILKPDTKSRYAYADLLFQLEKFELASKNYEEVSVVKDLDKTLAHDALYGALFAIEKSLEKKEDSSLIEKQKILAERYLKEFPNGEHIVSLQYKLGFIAYKQQDYDLSLKYLLPIASKNKYPELKQKSEDLILDIYNLKKDNKSIQTFAKNILKNSSVSDARKQTLTKIIEESHYAQIQTEAANLPTTKQIDQLHAFATEHAQSKLGQDAFWQSISLAYANGLQVLGADLSLEYAKKYPADKRKLDSIKEATKSYIDAGQIKKGILALRELAQVDATNGISHLETSCDLLRINNQFAEARGCYKGLFDQVSKSKKSELISKMIKSYGSGQSSNEIESLENQILKENIEPYATQLLVTKAKKYLADKKMGEAFNLALKINSRPVDADVRAEARLIQAQVLEKEFVSQSVKAKEAKFALVLSLKTEKLDKAYTAYSTTIKMSKSDLIQSQALQGIDRLYSHYIESISNMPIPDSLSAVEQKTLREELIKITQPFVAKKESNLAQLRKISKLSSSQSESLNWSEINVEKTIEPRLVFPSPQKLSVFIPSQFEISNNGYSKLSALEKKCDVNQVTAQSIGGCIQAKKMNEAESIAFKLSGNKETRGLGLYYLSLIADLQAEKEKALWLIEKAYALDPDHSLYNYQKGKVLYSVDGLNSALPYFEKVLDMKKTTPELVVMSALKSFSDRDYISATEEFSRLSVDELYNYSLGVLYVEATLLKGETEEALKLATKLLNSRSDYVDMWIEQGRIFEAFSVNKESAVNSYQKAFSKSANAEQKDWLKRKIIFLNSSKNSQITSYVGGN